MRPLFFAFFLAACQTEAPLPGTFTPTGDVLLTIDGEPLHEDVVRVALERIPKDQWPALLESGQFRPIIEKMAVGDAAYRKAIAQKLHEEPEVRTRLALAQRDALAQILIERLIDEQITEERVRRAYEERKVQFSNPEARVSLMIVGDRATADDVRAQLDQGADFAALAREKSLEPDSAARGGEFGWVTKGQLAGAIDQAIFANTNTGVVGPVDIGGGFVLARVHERRDARPFDEVRERLEALLRQEAGEKVVDDLERSARIEWKKAPEPLIGGQPGPLASSDAPVGEAPAEAAGGAATAH